MEGRNAREGNSESKGRITVKTSGGGSIPSNESARGPVYQEHSSSTIRDVEDMTAEEKLNTMYRMTNGLAQQMEKARIAEYTELLLSPWRLIGLNLLSGTVRGLGIALGFTFFAATIVYVLQVLGALNLPIIGDYIADIVRIVQHQLELKTF